MAYFIEAEKVSLDDLQKRIARTDLVPSRASLREGIEGKFEALIQQGIQTLANLRKELKNARRMEVLANQTGIELAYLALLRREIESYFPKPFTLKEFDWLSEGEIGKLEGVGIKNAPAFYDAARTSEDRNRLAEATGIPLAALEALFGLVDLSRVQWVSPNFARMLVEAGYASAARLAQADPEELCAALERVNQGGRFFKGKIGLRDIKRLVNAAGYVDH